MPSIACCFNIYNDNDALPGMLENASSFFDEIFCIHASPGGKPSTDGTMETLQKWGIKPVMADISVGFGVIRTNLIHGCKCDWAFIMDADERFLPVTPVMRCDGDEQYPANPNPNLKVTVEFAHYNQGAALRAMLDDAEGMNALVMRRRHWMDFSWKRPAQNFSVHADWQCRCIRNVKHVGYDPNVKLHERIIDFSTGGEPAMLRQGLNPRTISYDHFHNHFKPMNGIKNAEDLETYRALDQAGTENMWLQHQPKS